MKTVQKIEMGKILKRVTRQQIGLGWVGRNRVHETKKENLRLQIHRREMLER